MPNGREGDHPVTDILLHGKTPFSAESNELIREIARFSEEFGVYYPFAEVEGVLSVVTYQPERETELRGALIRLRERLRREWNLYWRAPGDPDKEAQLLAALARSLRELGSEWNRAHAD